MCGPLFTTFRNSLLVNGPLSAVNSPTDLPLNTRSRRMSNTQRRIALGIFLSLAGVILFGGLVLSAIYLCYKGVDSLCWANELRGFLLYGAPSDEYLFPIVFMGFGLGIWCTVDAWRRSTATVISRLGFAIGEGLEASFIGG